jgi:hypothetical protein
LARLRDRKSPALNAYTETIYIPLLERSAGELRPVLAARRAEGLYEILSRNDDPEDEAWQFPPGSLVRCEQRDFVEGPALVAVELKSVRVPRPLSFADSASQVVRAKLERLRSELSFEQALALAEADCQDIVVERKEVQLTIFRQASLPFLEGGVLVTVQLARHGLGGIPHFKHEQGLVFSPNEPARAATEEELARSAK